MFDNKERTRYYGLRIGDIVEEIVYGSSIKGEVWELLWDNNAAYVKTEKDKIVKCVAEWCNILTKVEDRDDFKKLSPLKLLAKRDKYNNNFHIIFRNYYQDFDNNWGYSKWYFGITDSIGKPYNELLIEVEEKQKVNPKHEYKILSDKEYWESINYIM